MTTEKLSQADIEKFAEVFDGKRPYYSQRLDYFCPPTGGYAGAGYMGTQTVRLENNGELSVRRTNRHNGVSYAFLQEKVSSIQELIRLVEKAY